MGVELTSKRMSPNSGSAAAGDSDEGCGGTSEPCTKASRVPDRKAGSLIGYRSSDLLLDGG